MSKFEILAELPNLTAADRAEIQARLEELAGEGWLDHNELTDQEKDMLAARLAAYDRNPDAGSSWKEVEARVQAKLRQ